MVKCKKKSVIKVYGEDYTWECKEEAIEGTDYCILHTDYPEFGSLEYTHITNLKNKKIKEKINNNDFEFIAAIIDFLEFKDMKFEYMDFRNAEIGEIYIENVDVVASFNANILFDGAKIKRSLYFINVNVGNWVYFSKVKAGILVINYANIGDSAYFNEITVEDHIQFMDVKLNGDIYFNNAKLLCDVLPFDFPKIKGAIYLKDTQFKNPIDQEKVFRIAKNTWENLGNRIEADYCFYKEMEAKRKQKKWYFRYPEVVIQYCFGYGVYPGRFIVTWISVIFIFTVVYSTQSGVNGNLGFWSYFYSSVVTAITPGFGTYRPEGIYQFVASVEAILGTFMWAAFIATFTRKYMR